MNMALRLVSKTLFKINNSETSVFPALVGAESKKGQQGQQVLCVPQQCSNISQH